MAGRNAMASMHDLRGAEAVARAAAMEREESGRVRSLSLGVALEDAGEALVGIPRDLFGGRRAVPLWDLATRGNRLRGVGVLCVCAGLAGLLAGLLD